MTFGAQSTKSSLFEIFDASSIRLCLIPHVIIIYQQIIYYTVCAKSTFFSSKFKRFLQKISNKNQNTGNGNREYSFHQPKLDDVILASRNNFENRFPNDPPYEQKYSSLGILDPNHLLMY